MKFIKSHIVLSIAFAAIFGFLIVTCLMFYEHILFKESSFNLNGEDREKFFNYHPEQLMWISVILFQPIVWIVLLFPATKIIIELSNELNSTELNIWNKILKPFFILFIPFTLFLFTIRLIFYEYLTLPVSLLINHEFKITVFIYIGQMIGVYYLFGVKLVGEVCGKNILKNNFKVTEYIELKSKIDTLMKFAAILFTLGTLSLILLNYAMPPNADKEGYESLPTELIVAFGLTNTIIILIVYLPSYFEMKNYGRRIIERAYNIQKAPKENWNDILNKQKELSETLNNSLSVFGKLKNALIILSPFISAILPKLIEFFTGRAN